MKGSTPMEVDRASAKRGHGESTDDDAWTRKERKKAAKKDGNETANTPKPTAGSTKGGKSTAEVSPSREKKNLSSQNASHANMAGKEKDRKAKYDAFGKPPFVVFFRIVSDKDANKKRTSLITISRKLDKLNVKFTTLAKYSRDTWKGSFSTKNHANGAITNPLLQEAGISAFIPKFKISRKVVLREIPIDITLEEVKQKLEEENQSVVAMSMFRLKRRNRETKELEDTESVCVEIKGESYPEKVTLWGAIIPVKPYVQSVRICFKCGRIGHISKFCDRPVACLMCAGEHRSTREESCAREKKCVNCGSNHSSLDRGCPIYRKQSEISRVMAYDNLPFIEARSIVEKEAGLRADVPGKTLKDFPSLPAGGSSSGADKRTGGRDVSSGVWTDVIPGGLASIMKLDEKARGAVRDIIVALVSGTDPAGLLDKILEAIVSHSSITIPKPSNEPKSIT